MCMWDCKYCTVAPELDIFSSETHFHKFIQKLNSYFALFCSRTCNTTNPALIFCSRTCNTTYPAQIFCSRICNTIYPALILLVIISLHLRSVTHSKLATMPGEDILYKTTVVLEAFSILEIHCKVYILNRVNSYTLTLIIELFT